MRNLILVGVVAGVFMTSSLSHAEESLDEALDKEFGSSRVIVHRAAKPEDVGKAKRNTADAIYAAAKRKCSNETDRHKDYCLREAEQAHRAAEYKIRAAQKKD
ncbi:MAG: hypothetical protein HYX63_14175 [Gammaproteobacteria bacterium]|nr:hypothetical protein [Gammaproteobacteria bacterium]